MQPANAKEMPRFFVYTRSPSLQPSPLGGVVHRVRIVHDPTSPPPRAPARKRYLGFAVLDATGLSLKRLFVLAGASNQLLYEWMLSSHSKTTQLSDSTAIGVADHAYAHSAVSDDEGQT